MKVIGNLFEKLFTTSLLVALLFVNATQAFGEDHIFNDDVQSCVESENTVNDSNSDSPIPLEWESEYVGVMVGYGEPLWVNYFYKSDLHINPFSEEDTSIQGTIEFRFYGLSNTFYMGTPPRYLSDSVDIGGFLCNGKAAFSGTYDSRTQSISMKITGWSDDPNNDGKLSSKFTPIEFGGSVNEDLTQILWHQQCFFKSKYTIPIDKDEEYDSGFKVIKDQNNKSDEGHNNNFRNNQNSFFVDWCPESYRTLRITEIAGLFENLKNKETTAAEISNIRNLMNKKWMGACYGISATMALAKIGELSISNICRENVDFYHKIRKEPKDNPYFRDVLHYYHLSQYLDKYGENAICEFATYKGDNNKGVSLSKFLSRLIEDARSAVKRGKVLLFNYSSSEGGHSILITKYKYRSREKVYELELYDMNGFSTITMTISSDAKTFNFTDGNKTSISEDTFHDLCYIDPEKFEPLNWTKANNLADVMTVTNYTFLTFSKDSSFKLTSLIGQTLTYDNDELSGNLPIFSLDYIDDNVKIKTSYCSTYRIDPISKDIDISIFDNTYFKAIEGSGIESISVSIPGDMKLDGKAYTFKAYASVDEMLDEKESGMGSIFAKGLGEVVIHKGKRTVEATSKKPMSGIETEVFQGINVVEGTIKGKQKSVILDTIGDINSNDLTNDGIIIFSKQGYAYRGRPIKPFVSVYVGGKSLKKNKDFTVTYENNVDIGTGTLTVTGKGEYEGTLSAEFPIIPKKVKMKKVVNYESGVQVTWKTNGPRDGFEIQYATDPEFKDAVSKKVEDAESVSTEIGGLVIGTEYFVRIRAYKTVGDEIFNSNWSDIKSILIYPY